MVANFALWVEFLLTQLWERFVQYRERCALKVHTPFLILHEKHISLYLKDFSNGVPSKYWVRFGRLWAKAKSFQVPLGPNSSTSPSLLVLVLQNSSTIVPIPLNDFESASS